MNWQAAVFGFMFVLIVAAGVAGLFVLVHWAGETFGPWGALASVIVPAAVVTGVAVGVSER